MINDSYIIEYFLSTNKKFKSSILRNIIKIPEEINNYLVNRFTDSIYTLSDKKQFYIYIVKRILYNIEEHPKCVICGKSLNLDKVISQHVKYCSGKCAQSDNILRNKIKETKTIRYGSPNYVNHEKAKQTCLERYGVEYTGQLQTKIEKSNKTWLERYGTTSPAKLDKTKETLKHKYGVTNVFQIGEIIKHNKEIYYNKSEIDKTHIKENRKQTCLLKYGVEFPQQCFANKLHMSYIMSSDDIIRKRIATCMDKYNIPYPIVLRNVQEKRYNTMKQNNSFNLSKIENELKEYFDSHNIDYIYQYKSDAYPFACDFYFPEKDLYVEIQGTWTHGGKPFEGTDEDLQKIQDWCDKNTPYYDNAIYTWTDLDVRKRNIAKDNNLNYLEIFSNKLTKCLEILKGEA